MAKQKSKPNRQLVAEFFAAEQAQGVTYFTKRVTVNLSIKNYLFRSVNGQNGVAISPNQLKETIRQWLIATGEVRTDKELYYITKAAVSNIPAVPDDA
jgi:hypothetical protein